MSILTVLRKDSDYIDIIAVVLSYDNCPETNLAGKLMSVFVFPWVVTICSLWLSSTLCDVTSMYIKWSKP